MVHRMAIPRATHSITNEDPMLPSGLRLPPARNVEKSSETKDQRPLTDGAAAVDGEHDDCNGDGDHVEDGDGGERGHTHIPPSVAEHVALLAISRNVGSAAEQSLVHAIRLHPVCK
ncbi:hypothetical protein PRIPAC_76223 [Pristionchus pacificus]|uniref:Uncharacterized protein n=1 Tax=Pristionchus pacificus TaxID=54126 RepID=A0A2A6C924_PRIPA|nr:hypothetical protein PRIPAC_76223 [Pristionchus pacificus]|eukprot:PDM74578.1 hypothetical protein PRIPAC_41934 [Pristionchus pacificus]